MTAAHHNRGVTNRGLPPVSLYDDIACRPNQPLKVFFPEQRAVEHAKAAKRICQRCPHTAECLDWALESGQDEGVWGGTTPAERRAIGRTRAMQKTTTPTAS